MMRGERWGLQNIDMSENIEGIIIKIIKGPSVGNGDGTFKHKFGTVSWVVKNVDGTQRIRGDCIIPSFSLD